jgi:hypothetical protein
VKAIKPGEHVALDDPRLQRPGKMRGLGDLVAKVAKPIAGAIDAAIGTDLVNCSSCGERQERWNKAVPFGRK